eukprot:189965_1
MSRFLLDRLLLLLLLLGSGDAAVLLVVELLVVLDVDAALVTEVAGTLDGLGVVGETATVLELALALHGEAAEVLLLPLALSLQGAANEGLLAATTSTEVVTTTA